MSVERWNPANTLFNIDNIEMVQPRAARFVDNDYNRYEHVSSARWQG